MDTLKNAGNYVSDKIQSATNATSKEANKEVAKDSNVGLGSRISAATDAVGDKAKETKHDTSAEAHKQAATH